MFLNNWYTKTPKDLKGTLNALLEIQRIAYVQPDRIAIAKDASEISVDITSRILWTDGTCSTTSFFTLTDGSTKHLLSETVVYDQGIFIDEAAAGKIVSQIEFTNSGNIRWAEYAEPWLSTGAPTTLQVVDAFVAANPNISFSVDVNYSPLLLPGSYRFGGFNE